MSPVHNLPPGSFSDTWAIQSREILIAAPDIPFTTQHCIPLVIGAIESQQARLLSSHPHSAADILSCLTPEAVIFLSTQLEMFWSRCLSHSTMPTTNRNLVLCTDATLQTPNINVMTSYFSQCPPPPMQHTTAKLAVAQTNNRLHESLANTTTAATGILFWAYLRSSLNQTGFRDWYLYNVTMGDHFHYFYQVTSTLQLPGPTLWQSQGQPRKYAFVTPDNFRTMRTLLSASTSVTISFDIDTHPETWGTRQSDQCDVFRVITCPAGTWPASLNSTLLPPSAHLDAYAFTCLWLEKLASVIDNMPHTYFKQYFLPLLPENLLHDNDPVIHLALRLYRRQLTAKKLLSDQVQSNSFDRSDPAG
jgi:hypothetical protein